jgi:hypothetical protein
MKRPGRLRRLWNRLLGRSEPPPDHPWLDDEDALVPAGPPRRPAGAAAVGLDPPSEPDPLVYPTETDAVGRLDDEDEPGESRAAAV